MKNKKVLTKALAPSTERILASSVPLLPIIPIILYVALHLLLGTEGIVVNFFHLVAFVSYGFISVFAIPFEGILEFFGMMSYGGGIFDIGIRGMNFAGMILVQLAYVAIFYAAFSLVSFTKKAVKYAYGRK